MIPNNNLSILPIYDSLAKQSHRKDYSFGEVYPLITPHKTILPFQKIRATRPDAVGVITAKLINMQGVEILDISAQLIATGLIINRYASLGFDVIIYPGTIPMDIVLDKGTYWLEMNDGTQTFYSEVFNMVSDVSRCLKIEFWDSENVAINSGLIDFTNDFKYRVYLDTQVGRPDYEFEEEVTRRDGYNFVEKQMSEKSYKFSFYAPEYLCDAMRIIRMMDNISIASLGDNYTADQFLITPKWQKGGYYAEVEAEFQCDTIIKKTGARLIPMDNTDPGANLAKVYIGSLVEAEPSELTIRALTEFESIKQNFTFTEVLSLWKRFCIAYPASFGDLTEAYVLQSFDILSVFKKIEMNFTFGETIVPMFVYVYESPITYLTVSNLPQTMHYNFTPRKTDFIIGDHYGGGIVAYVYQIGDPGYVEGESHGIVAAPYDYTPQPWTNGLKEFANTSVGLGTGKENTEKAVFSIGPVFVNNYAAYACKLVGIGDYHDWHLPSKDELSKMFDSKDIVGGYDNEFFYWSSSELDANNVYYHQFVGDSPTPTGTIDKAATGGVRAVRYF